MDRAPGAFGRQMTLSFDHGPFRTGRKRWGLRIDDVRTVAVGAICVMLAACNLGEIGDARTGAELAPSLDPLSEVVPDHYRRLADGTFDSLPFLEQWDFVGEVNEIARKRYEARQAAVDAEWRQATVESLGEMESMPPFVAELLTASEREDLLWSLWEENDSLSYPDWPTWYPAYDWGDE